MDIRIAGMLSSSISNGDGIRKVIFAQGCKHNCKECFNPHTHSFTDGGVIDTDGIINDINNDFIIDGITFSGGDPVEQAECFAEIASKTDKNIWMYTGYTWEQLLEKIKTDIHVKKLLENITVLVDGKFDCTKKCKDEYRGSSNQRIIDVKQSLKQNKIVLW